MNGIEIFEYNGEEYYPATHFEEWLVAIANFGKAFDRDRYCYLERHLLTDEVFRLRRSRERISPKLRFCHAKFIT